MDKYFYRQLCKDAKDLVDEIEAAAGNEIQIVARKEKENYGCRVGTRKATILSPRPDRLRNGPMIHELLHIQRCIVDNVPALEAADHKFNDENFCQNLGDLDNAIEHLAIVHHEIRLWTDRKGYWGKILHRELRCLSARPDIDGNAKAHATLCWALINRSIPSKKLLNNWKHFLEINDIFDFIEFNSNKILAASCKQEIVEILLPIIGIPLSDVYIS